MKNTINKYKFWILIVPVLAMLVSCTEKLEIKPKQSIETDLALTTADNIKAAMVGAYSQASNDGIFGSYFNEYSELYAATNDLRFMGTYQQPREFYNKEATTTNSYVETTWVQAYELINTCNTLLQEEVLAVLDDADADLVKGEALFLRGWIIFEMTRLFGLPYEPNQPNNQPGIPLVLTPTAVVTDAQPVARNPVEQCYAQAEDDLTMARDILPDMNGVYASSLSASAVLARLYLQMSNYSLAATEANRVIESGYFGLAATPMKAFNNSENSVEDIFAIQKNINSSIGWLTVMYASLAGAGRGDIEIQEVFLDRFDPSDLRGALQEDTQDGYTIDDITMMYYIGVGPSELWVVSTLPNGATITGIFRSSDWQRCTLSGPRPISKILQLTWVRTPRLRISTKSVAGLMLLFTQLMLPGNRSGKRDTSNSAGKDTGFMT
jgi:hypothetical protein